MFERIRVAAAGPLPYLLSLPSGERAGPAARPVLCFLHGHGEAGPRDIRAALTLHGPLRRTSSPLATREFIVVAPQLPVGGDLWHRAGALVRDIVREVSGQHGGDPARTYLTGFSFGANGVFDLGIAQPDLWAALWAVDPTRLPGEDPRPPIWVSFGEVSRRRTRTFSRALGLKPAGAEPQGERLCADDGQDHAGSATLAYRDERIYTWLLSKTKATDDSSQGRQPSV